MLLVSWYRYSRKTSECFWLLNFVLDSCEYWLCSIPLIKRTSKWIKKINIPIWTHTAFQNNNLDFSLTGPFSAATSYFSELSSTDYRSRVQLTRETSSDVAMIVLPLFAWSMLPHVYEMSISESISKIQEFVNYSLNFL